MRSRWHIALLWAPVNMTLLTVAAGQLRIDYPPKSEAVVLHQPAVFGVIASGTAPLSYQWRKDSVPIAGATNDQIVLAHSQFSDAGLYSVIVSNAEDSVTNADVRLSVRWPVGGDLDCSFACGGASVNGTIFSVAVQSNGKVVIAGDFSTVNDAVRGRVARLNADGTTDYTFMNGLAGVNGSFFASYPPGSVKSVAVQSDGKVLIGGNFTTVNGENRNGVARLNVDGTLDNGFQNGLSGANSDVSSVAVQSDGKVLIGGGMGGGFTTVNGVSRHGIARLNEDGTLDNGFQNGLSGANGGVFSGAVQSDGKVLIGGRFTMVNGGSRNGIARLNADGTLDNGFQNGLAGALLQVTSVAVQSGGKVLIGGSFTMVNGMSRSRIARLNGDGTVDSGFQNGVSGANNEVTSVAVQSDGKVLIGGNFSTVNGVNRSNIARLNADGTLEGDFQNGLSAVDGYVGSIAVQSDGKVLLGGASPPSMA